MNYGLEISASGVLAALYRQDVATNNLANANTVGFKPDVAATIARDPVRVEDGLPFLPSNALLERLGAGVLMAPNRTNFEQGSIQVTNNPLDLAVRGEGFFVVRDQSDGTADRIRLTRDGRFTRDQDGRLVMATGGLPVLDTANRVISLGEGGEVSVSSDGVVRQGGEVVAQLQLAAVPHKDRLIKLGESLYLAPASEVNQRGGAVGLIEQGAVEGSAVDEIRAMMRVSRAASAVEMNAGMLQYHDRMMDRAINVFGRVS